MRHFLRKHLQLTLLLVLIGIQLIAVAQGYVLLTIGGFLGSPDTFYVTSNILVMLLYKIWQEVLAFLHNRSNMRSVRMPVVEELAELLPDYAAFMRQLAKQYITIDRFLYELQRKIPDFNVDLLTQATTNLFNGILPPVSIVAPIYGLQTQEVATMMESIVNQVYKGRTRVYLIINDASDVEMYEFLTNLVVTEYSGPSNVTFEVIVEGKPGKREAQYTGFVDYCRHDGCKYIVNMDGDGFAHEFCLAASIIRMEVNQRLGLLTGDVRISNWKTNLLTMVTGIRYHSAFWKERAGQSPQMNCGSGPWLVMRAEALWPVVERWKNFLVAGRVPANFGDDRQLTLEIMDDGWETEVCVDAVVWTDCPTTMKAYRRQQTRWNKSAWIYNWEMYKRGIWHNLKPFVRFSVAYLTFYPFIVLAAILFVLLRAANVFLYVDASAALALLAPYLVSVLVVSLFFQSMSGIVLMRDPVYLLAPFYVPLWFWVQLPAKPISLLTIMDQGWGTRKPRSPIITLLFWDILIILLLIAYQSQ